MNLSLPSGTKMAKELHTPKLLRVPMPHTEPYWSDGRRVDAACHSAESDPLSWSGSLRDVLKKKVGVNLSAAYLGFAVAPCNTYGFAPRTFSAKPVSLSSW